MKRQSNSSSKQSLRQSGWIWTIILLLIAVVAGDSWKHHNRLVKCSDASLGQAALQIDRQSATGYELGMRRLILPLEAIDGLHWIMHAQSMLRDSSWRIRSTTCDNFPQGRDVHWSHGYLWSLCGCKGPFLADRRSRGRFGRVGSTLCRQLYSCECNCSMSLDIAAKSGKPGFDRIVVQYDWSPRVL
jgi:hypothetical protein